MRRAMFAAILVAAAGLLLSSCHEIPDQQLLFGPELALKDAKGKPVANLSFLVGETIEWCNTSSFTVIVTTDNRKVFGGRRSIRLYPGECVAVRVGRTHDDFTVRWVYKAEDGTVQGEGGNPGKVDCPPPPAPC